MKTTSFFPVFGINSLTDDFIAYMQDMGMQKLHHVKPNAVSSQIAENENPRTVADDIYIFGNEAGQRLEIIAGPLYDAALRFVGMHANVDDLEEGLTYFQSKGMKCVAKVELEHAAFATMLPSDDVHYIVNLVHHK